MDTKRRFGTSFRNLNCKSEELRHQEREAQRKDWLAHGTELVVKALRAGDEKAAIDLMLETSQKIRDDINDEKYAKYLHIPTREEREAEWRKPEVKEEEWYVSDERIKEGLKAMAFPSQDYERVNNCVVIAGNAIVVCFNDRLPYPIDVPIVEGVKEHVAMKKWANDTVLDGIKKAEKILLSRQ